MTNYSEIVQRWLDNEPLILDTETTGLGNQAEILEIAIIDRYGRTLFNQRVRPIGPIEPETIPIHGITLEQLHDAPTWSQIHSQVATLLHGRNVIAYNAPFDARLIDQSSRAHGLPTPAYTPLCAMQAWLQDSGQWATGVRFSGMAKALSHYGVPMPRRAHRAEDDCLTTLALLEAMARSAAPAIAA